MFNNVVNHRKQLNVNNVNNGKTEFLQWLFEKYT